MSQRIWFERTFDLGTPPTLLPELTERLRGTPARLEERVRTIDRRTLRQRNGDRWSIQEHAGHLSDLEPLWLGRVEDLASGRDVLREADLENAATWEADHGSRPIAQILAEFRARRARLVERIEALDDRTRAGSALHPRLRQPMTVADLAFFVAEHDDHHLASITILIGTLRDDSGALPA